MTLQTRLITATVFYPDAVTPWEGGIVSYRLMQDSYTTEATVPKDTITATVDEAGTSAAALWCNTEGLRESWWSYTLPDGSSGTFQIPEGTTPISLEYLRSQEDIYGWDPPEQGDVEAIVDGIFAAFANTADVALGDGLVGTKNSGTGATATTVHAKLGQMFFTSDYDTFADAVAAAAGETLVVNTSVSVPASMTVPATVGLCIEHGGLLTVASGQTLTINSSLIAGRYQIFTGSGTVAGTPLIDFACPEWFGAIGDGATDDTLAIQKAADFSLHLTGAAAALYKMQTLLAQHTTADLYSGGHVGINNHISQFPSGVWYGVRLRAGAVLEHMHFTLTTTTLSANKLHSAFICGDPTSATRTDGPTIRDCSFVIHADVPVAPYTTRTTQAVPSGETVWHIATDFTGWSTLAAGQGIRLDKVSEGAVGDDVWRTTIVSWSEAGRTITVVDGPNVDVPPGTRVRGPIVSPITTLICQSVDDLRYERNKLTGRVPAGKANNLIGMYCFDCRRPRVEANDCTYVEKLCGFDYDYDFHINDNKLWNTNQLVDLNKACIGGEILGNTSDRQVRDENGDGLAEMNGAVSVTMKHNRVVRGARGVTINDKGLVYRTFQDSLIDWHTTLAETVTVGDTTWVLDAATDMSHFENGMRIRLAVDTAIPDQTWGPFEVFQAANIVNISGTTLTVDVGPTVQATAGNRLDTLYHSVCYNNVVSENYFEWVTLQCVWVGDTWKGQIRERQLAESGGYDMTIANNTMVNCSSFTAYNRWNGDISIQQGSGIHLINNNMDHPAGVRSRLSVAALADDEEITVVKEVGKVIAAAMPIRIVQAAITPEPPAGQPDTVAIYRIEEIVSENATTATITLSRPLENDADADTLCWIGPGNGCGIGARSWIDEDTFLAAEEWEGQDAAQVPPDDDPTDGIITWTSEGADEISDCELLNISGTIKNCASNGFFLYRGRYAEFKGLTIQNCGGYDRIQFGMVVNEVDKRGCRIRGSVEIDNSTELAPDGITKLVSIGLTVDSPDNLNDPSLWSATAPAVNLWGTRIVGHATRDFDMSDSGNVQTITLTGATQGTFKLNGNSNQSGGIAWNAAAATVQTAVRQLGGDYANALVVGRESGPYTVYLPAGTATMTETIVAPFDGTIAFVTATGNVLFLFAKLDPYSITTPISSRYSGQIIDVTDDVNFGLSAASLTQNNTATRSMDITGIRTNDLIVGYTFSPMEGGWDLLAQISAKDTVSFRLTNRTGATVTTTSASGMLRSGRMRIRIMRA